MVICIYYICLLMFGFAGVEWRSGRASEVYSGHTVKLLLFVYCFSYCTAKECKQTVKMAVGNGKKAL